MEPRAKRRPRLTKRRSKYPPLEVKIKPPEVNIQGPTLGGPLSCTTSKRKGRDTQPVGHLVAQQDIICGPKGHCTAALFLWAAVQWVLAPLFGPVEARGGLHQGPEDIIRGPRGALHNYLVFRGSGAMDSRPHLTWLVKLHPEPNLVNLVSRRPHGGLRMIILGAQGTHLGVKNGSKTEFRWCL